MSGREVWFSIEDSMTFLQQRLRELRAACEANPPAPRAEPTPKPPKPPKKEKPLLYAPVDHRWKKLSQKEEAMLEVECDLILERAAKTPFTLSRALANYPQPVPRHLCIQEWATMPHSTTRGQKPKWCSWRRCPPGSSSDR